jgi:NAD(P)-dependent dehydrogenase (short-subunit alcohol dehydrogenase family)
MHVLITGCSSGFGKLAAEEIALEGHRVFATMRNPKEQNSEAANSLSVAKNVVVLEMDVTSEVSVENAVNQCMARGGVDCVIHNAGIGVDGVAEASTTEQFARILDVNLLGVHRLNRYVLPHMRARRSGLLIYISSGLGRTVLPYLASYCASKFALEAYAEALGYEVILHGIESVILQPGAYPSEFRSKILEPDDVERLQGYPVEHEEAVRINALTNQYLSSEAAPDPHDVTNAMLKMIEAPPGTRPMRIALRRDSGGLKMINQICSEVQGAMMRGMKLEHRLPARPQL